MSFSDITDTREVEFSKAAVEVGVARFEAVLRLLLLLQAVWSYIFDLAKSTFRQILG